MTDGLSRRRFLQALSGSALGLVAGRLSGAPPGGGRKKNIVFILADDLGWRDTSHGGSTFYRTPNIARLARQGMYFPNAYSASPLCSPTRASILTGQSPARIGITSPACHLPRVRTEASVEPSAAAHRKILGCRSATRLKLEYHTLAEALKEAGYATGHFGKWHLGREPYDPLRQGFDVDIPHWPGPGPAGSFVAPWKFPDFKERTPNEHIEDRMGDEAVAFLEAHKEGPFFLNYWQFSVHAPFDAKKELIEEYKARVDPENPQRSPTYAAMVQSLDDNVGKIMEAVERLGIAKDTIVIFFSDNGGNMYNTVDGTTPTSNAPLRGGKATMYEGGIRVPCIIVWPGVVQAGSTNPSLIQSVDFYPTILDILGLEAEHGQVFDGVSILAALRGNRLSRDTLFFYFPHAPRVPEWLPPSVSVRKGDFKLIRIFHDNEDLSHRYELYNLAEDMGERNNLAAGLPGKVKELDALIERFLDDTKAVVPKPNPRYRPDAKETVGGWKAGANGHASIALADGMLRIEANANDPMLITSEDLSFPAGDYTLHVRMKSSAGGGGQVFCADPSGRFRRGTGVSFAVRHDGQWQTYAIRLSPKQRIRKIRIDPCSAAGPVDMAWIRLTDPTGRALKEWNFGE